MNIYIRSLLLMMILSARLMGSDDMSTPVQKLLAKANIIAELIDNIEQMANYMADGLEQDFLPEGEPVNEYTYKVKYDNKYEGFGYGGRQRAKKSPEQLLADFHNQPHILAHPRPHMPLPLPGHMRLHNGYGGHGHQFNQQGNRNNTTSDLPLRDVSVDLSLQGVVDVPDNGFSPSLKLPEEGEDCFCYLFPYPIAFDVKPEPEARTSRAKITFHNIKIIIPTLDFSYSDMSGFFKNDVSGQVLSLRNIEQFREYITKIVNTANEHKLIEVLHPIDQYLAEYTVCIERINEFVLQLYRRYCEIIDKFHTREDIPISMTLNIQLVDENGAMYDLDQITQAFPMIMSSLSINNKINNEDDQRSDKKRERGDDEGYNTNSIKRARKE